MSDSLYDNLLRATDNTNDITTEKYATIVKVDGLLCSVKEQGTDLQHDNVPILNGLKLNEGDSVVIGFTENSIYNVYVLGSLNEKSVYSKSENDNLFQEKLVSGTNIKTINNESLLGSGNISIQGGGGSVIGTGSFSINDNGHLIVELPNGVDNPYYINNNGHLVYDTSNTHNEGEIQ